MGLPVLMGIPRNFELQNAAQGVIHHRTGHGRWRFLIAITVLIRKIGLARFVNQP
jgi:hypothetical protein